MRFTILEDIKSTLPKSLFYNYYSQIKSTQMLVFDERGKPEYPGKKPLMAEWRTNKLNPHMTPSAEIEPGPHWWKASALTSRPNLSPVNIVSVKYLFPFQRYLKFFLIQINK